MASFVKFDQFLEDVGSGVHQLHAAGHTLKVYLSNAAPSSSADAVKADLAEIGAGGGYVAGGYDIQNDYSQTAGVATLTGVSLTITAVGGSIGPFQTAGIYNDTPTSPADPLVGAWSYGSSITLLTGESLDILFDSEDVGNPGAIIEFT